MSLMVKFINKKEKKYLDLKLNEGVEKERKKCHCQNLEGANLH